MSQEGIQLHADFSNSFRNRYLIVGIVLTGFTFWCLYDGLVTYPKQREQTQEPWDKYQEIVEEITTKPNTEQPPETAIQEQDIKKRWEAIANEKGWSTELPPEEPKTDNDITVQYIMAAITGCLALPFLVSYFRSRGQWVELEADGIRIKLRLLTKGSGKIKALQSFPISSRRMGVRGSLFSMHSSFKPRRLTR